MPLSGIALGNGNRLKKNEHKTRMIERVLQVYNMQSAYQQVRKNKGSAGVDGIKVNQLADVLRREYADIKTEIRNGSYFPNPFLGWRFPKATERPVCWVFPPQPTECFNRRYHKY